MDLIEAAKNGDTDTIISKYDHRSYLAKWSYVPFAMFLFAQRSRLNLNDIINVNFIWQHFFINLVFKYFVIEFPTSVMNF